MGVKTSPSTKFLFHLLGFFEKKIKIPLNFAFHIKNKILNPNPQKNSSYTPACQISIYYNSMYNSGLNYFTTFNNSKWFKTISSCKHFSRFIEFHKYFLKSYINSITLNLRHNEKTRRKNNNPKEKQIFGWFSHEHTMFLFLFSFMIISFMHVW